jgi:hypothetical protein
MKTARTAELSSTEATVLSEAELLAILSRVTGLSANTKPLGKTGEDKRRPRPPVTGASLILIPRQLPHDLSGSSLRRSICDLYAIPVASLPATFFTYQHHHVWGIGATQQDVPRTPDSPASQVRESLTPPTPPRHRGGCAQSSSAPAILNLRGRIAPFVGLGPKIALWSKCLEPAGS